MTEPRLRPDQTAWLLACAILSLAPHASHLPLSLISVCALLLGWRGLLGSPTSPSWEEHGDELPCCGPPVVMSASA